MRLCSKSARQYRWDTIIRLREMGKSQSEIRDIVQISQSSVSRVLQQFSNEGKVEVKSQPGRPCRLSDVEQSELKSIVELGSVNYGFEGEYWTNKRLVLVIREKFGKSYQERQISTIMKKLGLSKQKFQKKDARQSAEKLSEWKEMTLPALKKKARRRNG